jgi:hypothetical protein
LPQRKTLGAIGAQPEILNLLVFVLPVPCMKTKKSASIKAHQRFGTLRIGTLRNHESVALPALLDVHLQCKVACNRKLPKFSSVNCLSIKTNSVEKKGAVRQLR